MHMLINCLLPRQSNTPPSTFNRPGIVDADVFDHPLRQRQQKGIDAILRRAGREPAMLHEPFAAGCRVRVYDPQRIDIVNQFGLRQFHRFDHHNRLCRFPDAVADFGDNRWMRQGIQISEGWRVVENDRPKCRSIDQTFAVEDHRAEPIDNPLEERTAWRHEVAIDHICINDFRAQLGEYRRDRRFPGRYGSNEADDVWLVYSVR
ncbi:MAG: hypothetical protein U0031_18530 [Thermomicrobiales bacterium]